MAKQLLKQRLDFSVTGKIETMDGLAIIKGQKIVESTVAFSRNRKDGNS